MFDKNDYQLVEIDTYSGNAFCIALLFVSV